MSRKSIVEYQKDIFGLLQTRKLKYLCDFTVDTDLYEKLRRYVGQVIKFGKEYKEGATDILMAIFIVQVARKNVDEESFWLNFFDETTEKHTAERITYLKSLFLGTLKKYHLLGSEKDFWAAVYLHAFKLKYVSADFDSNMQLWNKNEDYIYGRVDRVISLIKHNYTFDEFCVEDISKYEESLIKIKKKVTREIKKKKYIGDINLNDKEYEVLITYMHHAVGLLNMKGVIADEYVFMVAVVQVAIKTYKNGNFWGNFFDEIRHKNSPNLQRLIGHVFYDLLEKNDKIKIERNKYVQNILLHCYVSDHYAEAYFDFLYKFYSIDLERDLSRLDKYMMSDLMSSICSEEKTGRTYMLVQHVSQGMSHNTKGSKIRIRNHLKLIDKFFWEDDYRVETEHRIYNHLQKWAKSSKEIRHDIEQLSYGRNKGRKSFSNPYFYYDHRDNKVKIVLPSQTIKRDFSDDVYWQIKGENIDKYFEVDKMESIIGFKILECSFAINWNDVFCHYRCTLMTGEGEKIKSFEIKKMDVVFFDNEGYPINSNSIKTGEVAAIYKSNDKIESSALYETNYYDGVSISYLQFAYGDILKLPNGKIVIIGKNDIKTGLVEKGLVEYTNCCISDKDYQVYSSMPLFLLRVKENKYAGTRIEINKKSFPIKELDVVKFSIDDLSGDVGCYIDLKSILGNVDGIFNIVIDIPGNHLLEWRYVYLKDFDVVFEGAPYIFEPRGTVKFKNIDIKDIEPHCEKDKEDNTFKFVINDVGRTLDYTTVIDGEVLNLETQVPALFVKQNGHWSSERPAPIWHSDFPDEITLSVPYHKVDLYVEEPFNENSDFSSDNETRIVSYRKTENTDCIVCDVRKFKSFFMEDEKKKTIHMKFGEVDTELFNVMIHSSIVSMQVLGDFKHNIITINSVIVGKANYCFDLHKDGILIAEKILLKDGRAFYEGELDNGKYNIEVFEIEEDDSGFDELEYYSLGCFEQELINPYDMTGKSLKLLQIERKTNPDNILQLRYNYYIENLEMTDDNSKYRGMMVVEKNDGRKFAALPVIVSFENLDKPNYAWITFVDEYDEQMDFLYDTKRKGILQEENTNLPKLECYRRYSIIDGEKQQFHIEFCERECSDYFDVDEQIVFPEMMNQVLFSFRKAGEEKHMEKYIFDETWSKNAMLTLKTAGFTTFSQLASITKKEFIRRTLADEIVVSQIENRMRFYGYYFK